MGGVTVTQQPSTDKPSTFRTKDKVAPDRVADNLSEKRQDGLEEEEEEEDPEQEVIAESPRPLSTNRLPIGLSPNAKAKKKKEKKKTELKSRMNFMRSAISTASA